jgi:hypothetical protein
MVQNGKLAACALAFVKALKIVDFPTLGNPTIPHFNPILSLYILLAKATKVREKFYL